MAENSVARTIDLMATLGTFTIANTASGTTDTAKVIAVYQ